MGRGRKGKYSGTSTLVSWLTQTQTEHAITKRSKKRGEGKDLGSREVSDGKGDPRRV